MDCIRRISLAAVFCLAITAGPGLRAERLPFTSLTRADGLLDDVATSVATDARGFLWIGTVSGVSRYDGSLFRSYEVRDGLTVHTINSVLATRDGDVWFASNGGGVARLASDAKRRAADEIPLTRYRFGAERQLNRVNMLVEEDDGALWAATDGGLFRLPSGGQRFERVPLAIEGIADETLYVPAIVVGPDRRLWLGTERGLIIRTADGATQRVGIAANTDQTVRRLVLDADGLIWAASTTDLRVLRPPQAGSAPAVLTDRPCSRSPDQVIELPRVAGEACAVTVDHGLPTGYIQALTLGNEGGLLIGTTSGGLGEIAKGRLRIIEAPHDRHSISALVEDRRGNLWVSTDTGVLRLARDALVTFDSSDGLRGIVRNIFGGRQGGLFVMTEDEAIHGFDGGRFRRTRAQYPPGAGPSSWGQRHFVPDPRDGWWIPTSVGLCRYEAAESVDALARSRASRCYTVRDGLPSNDVAHAMFDGVGALWVATVATAGPVIARRDPASETFAVLTVDGLSPISTPVALAEDANGAVWVGFRDGGVARCEARRCALMLRTAPVSRVLADRAGHLWVTTRGGLLRVDKGHGADVNVAHQYTTRDGLASDATYALAEDQSGRIYVGTNSGVDCLDPATGAVRHLSAADGLVGGAVVAAFRDDAGRLWFGTRHGISRFDPSEAIEPRVVEPRIAFIRMGSTEWPVGEFGETRVAGVALPSRDTTLEIGFFATEPGQPPRLQYRLRDVDEWADARRATTAVYPRLAPGDYEFQVRALAIDGVASTDIASVQFSVPPPFWLSWPFVAVVGMIVAGAAYAVHRVRLARLVALERIRTRIATDLHDDIGSTLTRIAMLAEGARRRAGASAESINAPLAAIATASRDLVETVSDIVWAVNPRRDSLRDLTHRMRRFAEETLGECDVALTFSAPPDDLDIALGADLRREIYLIFKECVTNIAKHGHATRASVAFRSDGHRVRLTVADDGRGFDSGLPSEGTGLASMRRRARALGGSLTVESASGRGTRVTLEVDRTISASRPYTSE